MSFDWQEFLSLAERLQAPEGSVIPREADLRSSASRAYYAAFHQAVDYGITLGYLPSFTGNDHFDIQKYLRNHKTSGPIHKKIALQLNRLYDLRRQADYFSTLNITPASLASSAVQMAKIVISSIESL